jgi:acyl homoserine lactone synthase
MLCVAGRREELLPSLVEDMGRYRHKVFVDHLGWSLISSDDVESDEFDQSDAVYVSSRDEHGQVSGVARLLPTTTTYLLEKVFSSLWAGSELPHSAKIWELSRFACVNFNKSASAFHQATSKSAAEFFKYVTDVAISFGAEELITVSPIGMERLLATNGYKAMRAGLPMKTNEGIIVALKISLINQAQQISRGQLQ